MPAYSPLPKPSSPKKRDWVDIIWLGFLAIVLLDVGMFCGLASGVIFSALITGDSDKGPAWPFWPCMVAGIGAGMALWWQIVKKHRG